MDFGALPPEINSGRMYCGPGSGPMLAAAAAWDGVAVELGLAATGYASVIAELTGAPWVGAASLSMVAAATPYVAWLSQAAARAEQAGMQAAAAAAAYEAAFVMTVPPPVITANRVLVMTLIATNFFGQNSAAIAVAEAQYAEMWAQDAVAMYGYAAASASASRLIPFAAPPKTTNSAGVVAQVLQRLGHIVHQLVRRGGVDGLLDRDGLLKEPAGVGDQWGVLERQQRLGRRRRRGGVAIHRLRVLAPHLAVCGLIGLDRRRVLPQEVGRGQRHQFGTVLGDHRRGHRQPIRCLVGRRSNPDLGGGQLGLPRGDAHPRHIRRGRRRHQTRRRTYPRPHRQTPDHRLKRRRGRKQVTRHALGGGVAANLGRAASVGSLSVPQAWAAANQAVTPAARALPLTSLTSAAERGPGQMLGGLPVGQMGARAGGGLSGVLRVPPRPYVMPHSPAAG